jgi:Ca2+-binding RTX toxin-like protein
VLFGPAADPTVRIDQSQADCVCAWARLGQVSHGETLLEGLLYLFDNGNDHIFGGPGDDDLDGQKGEDTLLDTQGTDTMSGGAGGDNINVQDGLGGDTANGGLGTDTYTTDPADTTTTSC